VIDFIELNPYGRSALELNTLDYPISQSFEPEIEIEEHKYKRAIVMGEWPAYHPEGALYITIQGDVVGNLGANYTTRRDALTLALTPFYDVDDIPVYRNHGFLRLQLTGWASIARQDYVVTSKSIPMTTQYVSVSEFHVTLKFPIPYFVQEGGSTRYYLA
jgi:hypothetical protein